MTTKCTIKIEEIHECGQVLGQMIVSMEDGYDLAPSADYPPFLRAILANPFEIPEIPPPTLTLTGTYKNVEITGFEVEDGHQRCVKCGQIYSFQESEATS